MKREEQIKEMAKFHASCMTCDKDMRVAFADALRRGAQWSDEHPDIDVRTMAAWRSGYKEAIENACEWLEQNAYHYCDDIDTLHESALIGDFRHVMRRD